ncbi:syntaxin-7-like [Daphnia pulicaria]|jgi:hypothetical protein|uniref:syntaxin-7-like n=1 Tax=Daphnia pulicaria TaxID=35523 RepID=UPI001EEBA849|nr:syntaxin-7-like [Daphnia pulicaria]
MADFNDYQSQFFYQPIAAEEWIRQYQRIDRQLAELQFRLEIGNDLDLIHKTVSGHLQELKCLYSSLLGSEYDDLGKRKMVIELIATATRLLSQIEQRKQFKDRLTPVFPNTGDQQMKMEEHKLLGMKQLHRSVESLNDVFKSLAQHVADQDSLVDSIESQIEWTSENINEGCQQLIEAKSSQNGKRWLIAKFTLVATFIVGIGLLLL